MLTRSRDTTRERTHRGGEGEQSVLRHKLQKRWLCNVRVGFRVALRMLVPCVLECEHLKPNVRLRECGIVHCSGCGAVRGQTSLPVSWCAWFSGWGAAESRDLLASQPQGVCLRSRHTSHALPTSWAPVQKRSWTLCPTLFAFRGSRRQWAVNPRTRVSRLLSNRLSGKTQSKSSLKALTFMPFSCEKLSRSTNLCSKGINLRLRALTPVLKSASSLKENGSPFFPKS